MRTGARDVQRHVWTPEDDARIREMATRGLTASRIGEAMRKTRNQIVGRAARTGIKLPGQYAPPLTEEERERRRREKQSSGVSGVVGRRGVTRVASRTQNTTTQHRPSGKMPVHVTTKNHTVLHVYARPSDMKPVATYDLRGGWWVRRDRPAEKHRSQAEAARSCVP